MKICNTDLHIIIEENAKPRVVHQQGQILLNYADYIKNRNDLRGLTVDFNNLAQVKQTIELLTELVKVLEGDNPRSLDIFFDSDNDKRYR